MRPLLHALILSVAWGLRVVSEWLVDLVDWDQHRGRG